ncbi:MAG: phospho-N-acetylmuramoyl-pentapeptide-transferase [Gemmatimonadota bacterium]|nr:MAG: phospho-N-acetylmuramoyl-pentapeptide-transferase [Gemmatimonadota bacterium]
MLADFLYGLHEQYSIFNVFRYITFRSAYAAITAFLLSLLLGPWAIAQLRARGVVKHVRNEGPDSHQSKTGTPTMGGLLILAAITFSTLLWADLSNAEVRMALGVTLALGAIGFLDDYLQVVRKQNRGLVGRAKIVGQVVIGLVVGFTVLQLVPRESATATTVPFLKERMLDLGWLYIPFVVFVLTGASNAVNLTDGLDGLAIGVIVFAAVAFAVLSYLSGHSRFAEYLQILYLPGAGQLAIFCSSIFGAALGFLWYNAHPAEVFMGDTGSLSLGGALGIVAILLKMEIIFAIVGGVFVAEALSVILQVASFRLTGRRIFRMAPIHHHFELLGWAESKVVVRFWIIAGLFALLSLSTLKIR